MSVNEMTNLDARRAALRAVGDVGVDATSLIEYRSSGRLVVIGDEAALAAIGEVPAELRIHLVVTDGRAPRGFDCSHADGREVTVTGHLGDFRVTLGHPGSASEEGLATDLVLDLGARPLLDMPIKPPGYLAPAIGSSVKRALEQLSGLTGHFEKPRYFNYDADVCAHGRAGISGCNRCVAACPAQAITSLGEAISVDPYLCQGGGICATVCPTGAITYAWPNPANLLDRVRTLLRVYRENGGQDSVIALVADADADHLPHPLAPNVLPVVIEELASAGLDTWFSALAYGAGRVVLAAGESVHGHVRMALEGQLLTAEGLLRGLGIDPGAVVIAACDELPVTGVMPALRPATHAGNDEKRRAIALAIDHITAQLQPQAPVIPLAASAPFGRIHVDTAACTLCMSCTSVCPARALGAGGDAPALYFFEANCVQCGICASACPEEAIRLEARWLFDPQSRRARVTLYEEEPFCCIQCGKPFATRRMIDNMLGRLEGHWMFTSERARARLQMCEECRVVDAVQDADAMQHNDPPVSRTH